jgi:NADH-quinone oxidoreductase subunit J
MDLAFLITALVILLGAGGAMALRNLVHCALSAALAFGGLAAAFLQLRAEFVGFAQLLVYVGAVAILIVITLLLTRNFEVRPDTPVFRPWTLGVALAVLVAGAVVSAIVGSGVAARPPAPVPVPAPTVKAIGDLLMTRYVVALEVMGLLLTAALIGAVILALREDEAEQ